MNSHAGPRQLRRLLDAVMSLGSDLELEVILRRLVETAAELIGANYGALGVLDESRTYLSDFITVGIDDATIRTIGDLPKGHGILGTLIVDPRPLRLPQLSDHADSFGFPPGHPEMTSFLGVPVFVGDVVFGNLYLTDKLDDEVFTDVDEELAVALASAAGTAIDKARLHARVRELDLIEDRDRIARDLHDTVIQRLFATGLSLQGAAWLVESIPDAAARIQSSVDELDDVVRQIRSTIFELHSETDDVGLRRRLLSLGDSMAPSLGCTPRIRFDGPVDISASPEVTGQLLAVAGEALTNVARHASSSTVDVMVRVRPGRLTLTVDDEGVGPHTTETAGHGLENMQERALALGGECSVSARPERGTRVRWSVPIT